MSGVTQFSARNNEAFLAALDRIAAANREPTPQEAGCLFSALGAMANGDERSAERWIGQCQHVDCPRQLSWQAPGRRQGASRRTCRTGADREHQWTCR